MSTGLAMKSKLDHDLRKAVLALTALGLTRMTPGLSAVRHTVCPSRRHSASLTARQPPRSTCVNGSGARFRVGNAANR